MNNFDCILNTQTTLVDGAIGGLENLSQGTYSLNRRVN